MNCISGIRRRKPWCPTKVDSNGIPVPGEWGNCNDQCPTEGSDIGKYVNVCYGLNYLNLKLKVKIKFSLTHKYTHYLLRIEQPNSRC